VNRKNTAWTSESKPTDLRHYNIVKLQCTNIYLNIPLKEAWACPPLNRVNISCILFRNIVWVCDPLFLLLLSIVFWGHVILLLDSAFLWAFTDTTSLYLFGLQIVSASRSSIIFVNRPLRLYTNIDYIRWIWSYVYSHRTDKGDAHWIWPLRSSRIIDSSKPSTRLETNYQVNTRYIIRIIFLEL
jgi:hypothetical protein